VEWLWPRLDTSTRDDAEQLRAQVLRALPVAGNDVHGPLGGQVESFLEERAQFGEDRHPPIPAVFMGLVLGSVRLESAALPINIPPGQQERFGWTAHPAVTAQGHKQPPLGIGAGVDDFLNRLTGYERLAALVRRGWRLHMRERVFRQVPMANRGAKELPGTLHGAPACRAGKVFAHPDEKGVAIPRRDAGQVAVISEEIRRASCLCPGREFAGGRRKCLP